jgi:hypothetical protein
MTGVSPLFGAQRGQRSIAALSVLPFAAGGQTWVRARVTESVLTPELRDTSSASNGSVM